MQSDNKSLQCDETLPDDLDEPFIFSSHPTNQTRPNLSFIEKTLSLPPSAMASLVDSEFNLFHIMHQLMLTICDLSAGVVNIQRVASYQYGHTFGDFEAWLQVLETYGTGYADDIDAKNYKLRERMSHRQ